MDGIIEKSLLFAFLSALCFSAASLVYTLFSQKVSAYWMNAFKATVSFLGFAVAVLFTKDWSSLPQFSAFAVLFLSGFIGLNVGDWFLLKGYERMGSARTLMVFAFQPLFIALLAYLFLGQPVTWKTMVAIFFMIACLFSLSLEGFHKVGRWELLGPVFALVGVFLDCVGVVMSRWAFDTDSSIGVVEANFYRSAGAAIGFYFLSKIRPLRIVRRLRKYPFKTRFLLVGASFAGTFLSLWLYLAAIAEGNLAAIAAVVASSPLFNALFECLISRRWPGWHLLLSTGFFIGGAVFLFELV